MTSGSIFGDVIEWFLSRVGDRRQYQRRTGAFHVWWGPNGKTAIGTEISPAGLIFIAKEPLPARELNLTLGLRGQKLPVRVKLLRSDRIDRKGEAWNRYVCEFLGIAADHWDLIVRYVNDAPEPVDRRKMQNQEMSERVDDAYRLLPMAIQQKIVDILVQQHKLEATRPGQTPLLKLFYGGIHRTPSGPPMHRFNVHSRIVVNDETIAYDTRFLIGENGEIKLG